MPEPRGPSAAAHASLPSSHLSKDQPDARGGGSPRPNPRFQGLSGTGTCRRTRTIAPGRRYVGRVSDGFKTLFANPPDRSRRPFMGAVRARIQARSAPFSGTRYPHRPFASDPKMGALRTRSSLRTVDRLKSPKRPVPASMQARAGTSGGPYRRPTKARTAEHELAAGRQGRSKVMILDMWARSAPSGRSPRSANSAPRSWRT
jgi:hypothetical protein